MSKFYSLARKDRGADLLCISPTGEMCAAEFKAVNSNGGRGARAGFQTWWETIRTDAVESFWKEADALHLKIPKVRVEFTAGVDSFVKAAATCPQFARRLNEVLSLASHNQLSKRIFIERHLRGIKEFRELLELTGTRFSKAWRELTELIRYLISWVWKLVISAVKNIRAKFQTQRTLNCFYDDRQKLWPLILAFKNQ